MNAGMIKTVGNYMHGIGLSLKFVSLAGYGYTVNNWWLLPAIIGLASVIVGLILIDRSDNMNRYDMYCGRKRETIG